MSFKGHPHQFVLPEETRSNLLVLVGRDDVVDAIEAECRRYLFFKKRPSKGAVKTKLRKLNVYLQNAIDIIDDYSVREELSRMVRDHGFTELSGRRFAETRRNICRFAIATQEIEKLPKGKDQATWALGRGLHNICEKAGLRVVRMNRSGVPTGILHKILAEIRRPLGITKSGDGIFDNVIKEIEASRT
jgi:hypothetical protein